MPTINPNAIDLTTLAAVKNLAGAVASTDDQEIQDLITGFSQYVLARTGRDSLNSVGSYNENYDGNGNSRLFLRNSPIVSVVSVTVGAFTLQQSTSLTTSGWYIEQGKKSIGIRCAGGIIGFGPNIFSKGQGNVQVNYTAGYAATPFDLEVACREAVAIGYKRKSWQDQESKSLSGGGASGTTKYRNWALPPHVERVLLSYQRMSR